MGYSPSNKQGNYIRAINVSAQLLSQDQATLAGEPKEIAGAVGLLAEELYKVQNAFFEAEGFEEAHTQDAFPSRSRTSKPYSSSSKPSTPKSSGSGGLNVSPKQKRFFETLIDDIEQAGAEPKYTYDELNSSSSYDERQERVDELIEQRNDLK